jgi:hypothetical protein
MATEVKKPICGVVMPISAIDGCEESHWSDVYEILSESIESAGFSPNLVSNADDVGIIHKRILQNLYDNPIVVCDVSGKNPNVMFELGLRLAFDKPTIIVKDEKTAYSFDTSAIEHIEYPRDLRFSKIVEFKQKLAEKIRFTHQKATSDSTYTTFLKHFGEFTVAKIEKKEVSGQEYLLEELKNIRNTMDRIEREQFMARRPSMANSRNRIRHVGDIDVCLGRNPDTDPSMALDLAATLPGVKSASLEEIGPGHKHLIVKLDESTKSNASEIEQMIRKVTKRERLARPNKLSAG